MRFDISICDLDLIVNFRKILLFYSDKVSECVQNNSNISIWKLFNSIHIKNVS